MFPSNHQVVFSGRKHVPSHPKQKEVGHIACCWVASSPNSKQRRNHLCRGNVLMYAANFQYLVVTTADHSKNANWCTAVSMRACHKCRISCQGADQSIPTGGGIMRRSIFRISMSYLRTSLGYSVRWPAAKQATGVITTLKNGVMQPESNVSARPLILPRWSCNQAICVPPVAADLVHPLWVCRRDGDWTSDVEWHGILHNWNIRVQDFASAAAIKPWSRIVCKQHWDRFCYVAHLPEHRWVRRMLAWNPAVRTRQVGRPRHTWDQKVTAFCRYKQLGHWLDCARHEEAWLALSESFYNFCMAWGTAICKYRFVNVVFFWFTACA